MNMSQNRRWLFIAPIALTTVWLVEAATGAAPQIAPHAEPLFRFLQINDTHVQSAAGERKGYEQAVEKLRWLIRATTEGSDFPRPDLVVGIGDLIHGESLDALGPDLRLLREMLHPLRVPLYTVVGNHEVKQQEGNPRYEQAYRDAFGGDRLNYTFTHGGVLFVALNNSGACCVGPGIVKARNDWLRRELERAPHLAKIILCHIPLVPLREESVLAKSFGFASYMDRDGETLNIVEAHADSVVAVLSGHLHLSGVVRRKGIHHVCVAGTASYPCDYALYAVFPDRVEVSVRQLPSELVTPRTNIHGKPRHPRDFIDAGHPDPRLYVAGRPDERAFVIPLPNRLTTRGLP